MAKSDDKGKGGAGSSRVEKSAVNSPEVDIFEEVLTGKKASELKEMVDKNEEGLIDEEEGSSGEEAEEKEEEPEEETEEDGEEAGGEDEEDDSGEEEPEEGGKEKEADAAEEGPAEGGSESGEKETAKEEEEEPVDEAAEDETVDHYRKNILEEDEGAEKEEDAEEDDEEESGEEAEEEDKEESDSGEGDESEEDAEEGNEGEAAPKKSVPSRDAIRKTILSKADMAAGENVAALSAEKLRFLADSGKKNVFIGRKAGIFKKYGYDGALQVGRVKEQEFSGHNVFLDSLNPHVIFVCGARGSGKSYVLGVVAEELAEKNRNVGTIVVDPIGVFWSMRFPNNEEKEIEKLIEWNLEPKGLENLKVFIPEGVKDQVPKATYDAGFSMQPSLLTGEDWALTFGVDRFSVSGLLLEKALIKVEKGYKHFETGKKIPGKGKNYSIDELIHCLETDLELNSREKGYKQDSIRAIVSRFEAAKHWGIFHEKGTPLSELSREGQLTILDTSFLEDNVTALVIGILARRLLSARKISTRKEAANKFKSLSVNELLELEVPPTWLFIDEAHTLIPSGNEVTPATAGLIEYVKQGRRPGLSLVFATQQPSAINTKVLSQLDVIMTHKLIFDDDIKAVFKRTPTIIPRVYRAPNFIKTLPVGVALTGDRREETSRAFVMEIRPRKSQHEGRDAETSGLTESLDSSKVEKIAVEMLSRTIAADGKMDSEKARMAVETLNSKYHSKVDFEKVLALLAAKGMISAGGMLASKDFTERELAEQLAPETAENALEEEKNEGIAEGDEGSGTGEGGSASMEESRENAMAEKIELLSLPVRVNEEVARRMAENLRRKKFFGLLGADERLESVHLKHFPIWRVKFDAMARGKEFISRECFINSLSGELMHFRNGDFIESKGLKLFAEAGEEEALVMKSLRKKELLLEEVMAQNEMDEAKARRILQKLSEKGIVSKASDKKSGKTVYWLKEKIDLPPNERHDLLGSLAKLPFVRAESLGLEKETFSKERAIAAVTRLWKNIVVRRVELLYKPAWKIVYSKDARERAVLVDAVNGKIIS